MFFATYLRRELRRRMRQAIFVALGLAVGIGLVVTVSAASAGVKKAEASVLSSLYGVGTDVTVTGQAPQPKLPSNGQVPKGGTQITGGPNGGEVCQNGKCENAAGKTIYEPGPRVLADQVRRRWRTWPGCTTCWRRRAGSRSPTIRSRSRRTSRRLAARLRRRRTRSAWTAWTPGTPRSAR